MALVAEVTGDHRTGSWERAVLVRPKRMPLVTQATYARRRGVSREAVRQRTTTNGGPIPVHGPRKLIDVEEADALWEATTSPAGASHGEAAKLLAKQLVLGAPELAFHAHILSALA